jgi:hypothetical protein
VQRPICLGEHVCGVGNEEYEGTNQTVSVCFVLCLAMRKIQTIFPEKSFLRIMLPDERSILYSCVPKEIHRLIGCEAAFVMV